MKLKKQDVGVSDIDSYLRKMKITTDTKITLALLIELMYGFTKENFKDRYVLTEDELEKFYNDAMDEGEAEANGDGAATFEQFIHSISKVNRELK